MNESCLYLYIFEMVIVWMVYLYYIPPITQSLTLPLSITTPYNTTKKCPWWPNAKLWSWPLPRSGDSSAQTPSSNHRLITVSKRGWTVNSIHTMQMHTLGMRSCLWNRIKCMYGNVQMEHFPFVIFALFPWRVGSLSLLCWGGGLGSCGAWRGNEGTSKGEKNRRGKKELRLMILW